MSQCERSTPYNPTRMLGLSKDGFQNVHWCLDQKPNQKIIIMTLHFMEWFKHLLLPQLPLQSLKIDNATTIPQCSS